MLPLGTSFYPLTELALTWLAVICRGLRDEDDVYYG